MDEAGSGGADGLASVLLLTGPTAVGKSSIALEVAEAIGGEIVSADSRQAYRGLDIGTATPPPDILQRVPHHLVNFLDVSAAFTAGLFCRVAEEAIADIQSRSRHALVVGGSTLYVESLVHGLADLPDVSADIASRTGIEAATAVGRSRLFAELQAADPASASTLDPTKSQRLTRLVGLLRETGRPPSVLWQEGYRAPLPHRLIVLDRPRDQLYDRIERRVDAMLGAGWLQEVSALLNQEPPPRPLLDATIGYRELAAHLDGDMSLEEAVRLIKRNSRRYAKRQLTWFRRYETATWLDARTASAESVLEAVAPWPSRT